jgi:hypothetical protein
MWQNRSFYNKPKDLDNYFRAEEIKEKCFGEK